MATHCQAMVDFMDAGAEVFDYGNALRGQAQDGGLRAGVRLPRLRARLYPAAVLRGHGTVPLGRAVRRPGATSRRPTGRCSPLFPDNEPLQRWIRLAREKVAFQGLPARICWLGYGERHVAGLRFNDLVARGDDLARRS